MSNRLIKAALPPLAATLLLAGAAAAHPDFSGLWLLENPHDALTTLDGKTPPLLPDAAKAYAATKARRDAGDTAWDGVSTKCKPPGEPRINLEGMPIEIMQQKDKMFFSYQWNRLDRFVYLDVPLKIIKETYFSTSAGKWDGDTLVVDAEGLNGETTMDPDGMPESEQTKLTERFSLSPGGNQLTELVTVDDPTNFSAKWDTKFVFARQNGRLQEDVCETREGLYKE